MKYIKNFHFLIIKKKTLLCFLILFLIGILALASITMDNLKITKNKTTNTIHKIFLTEPVKNKAKVAIIIDDFGYFGQGTEEMIQINKPLTCAVIPFLPYTKHDAQLAHSRGHEVIIHIPMEPHMGNPKWLGEKGITTTLTSQQIEEIIKEAIEEIPYAVGLNNHMGSKATEDRRIIEVIMAVLKERNMYIVDSKTSIHSVIREVAQEYQVPVLERRVFLDNEKNIPAIKNQLRLLGEIAIKEGTAIGIGHVGPEGGRNTAIAIQEMIPVLEAMGIELVTVSQIIRDTEKNFLLNVK